MATVLAAGNEKFLPAKMVEDYCKVPVIELARAYCDIYFICSVSAFFSF
jgi:hypothetical protein